MLGWIFGGLVKKLECAARNVSQDLVKDTGQEVERLIDQQLYPLANQLDYIAQQRINQSIDASKELKNEFKDDIESILTNADDKARQTLEKIDRVREEAIRDLRKTIGQTDTYLENRIDQFSLVVMEVLRFAQDGLIEPTLTKINLLEDRIFQRAEQLIDKIVEKINEILEGKIEQIRNELKRYLVHALPGPFDKCRQKLKIAWKTGAMLSDIELYDLSECYELSKLNENLSIDDVVKIYGQLQLSAARMAALARNAPELKRRAIQDWLKYGVLCKFWSDTIENYSSTAPLLPEPQKPQKCLTD